MAIDYTTMTYENILDRCLSRVSSNVDKREGSIIYDAIAPAAAELAMLYATLSAEMDRAFPDTATDVDLTNKAKERSVFRLPTTYAVRKALITGVEVPIGSRFSGGDVNYVVTDKIKVGEYQVTAEEAGEIGNHHFGILFPIDYIDGLASATLADILIPGEDEETDDALRIRYYASLDSKAFGGNAADYKEKTEALAGVGQVKVFPVWNGGGTVKLVITDSLGNVPSSELIATVQNEMDPVGYTGQGIGLAPIGHTVTVEGVTGSTVNIAFVITFESGYDWAGVQSNVKAAIQSYFDDLIATWVDASAIIVRISQLESKVLLVNGVLDISGTTINGVTGNLSLTATEIPLLGTVTNNAP